jgi:NAD(P)-dependent dehydrogenase (short-subunit alcohol dehydrogenase family)
MPFNLSFPEGVVLIVGGTGGIGQAICRKFAGAGVPVFFTYHSNKDFAEHLYRDIESAGGTISYRRLKLSHEGKIVDMLSDLKEKYGRISNVVYASGPAFNLNFIKDIPNIEWRRVIDEDVNGCFNLVKATLPLFLSQGDGHILALITAATKNVPSKDILSAAPKAAIEMLIRGIAKEYGRFGIRANCVGPGWVHAGLGKIVFDEKLDERQKESVLRSIPMRRIGTADEVANAVLFLCSQQASFICGQSLSVDGGAQI